MYLHNLDPFAIQFGSHFGIRWYGLAYLVGFVATYYIIVWLSKRGLTPLKKEQVGDFIFAGAVGTIVGGRFGYCLLYSPDLLTDFRSGAPFWGVLAINEGGMASHGGIIGVLIACIFWGRRHKVDPWHLADLTTLGGTVGVFFGRIANFINGELVGRPCETLHSWCVRFPQDILLWPSKEPQRLAALADPLSELGTSQSDWISIVQNYNFNSKDWNLLSAGLERMINAVQEGNLMVAQKLAPLLDARHPSQLYESLLEGLFIFVCLSLTWRKAQKPGIICALFFVVYSVVRIVGEQFRMPDAQIGYQLWGLTRGQWLSFGLLSIGVAIFIWCRKRQVAALGGWSTRLPAAK